MSHAAGPGPDVAPDDFRVIRRNGIRVLAREEAVGWVETVLAADGTLHGTAAAAPGARRFDGRGAVFAIPAPGAPDSGRGTRWVVRHYSRGGAFARLLGDRYFRGRAPRAFRETAASEALRARGFRTPRVIAAADYPAGPFRRGDLVTELVPDAVELAEVLFARTEDSGGAGAFDARQRVAALRAAGSLVRSLSLAGAFHPDLNVRNILLQWDGGMICGVHLIDLDRCRTTGRGRWRAAAERTAAARGRRMYRRLCRSLRKWEGKGARLSADEWCALALAYADAHPDGNARIFREGDPSSTR